MLKICKQESKYEEMCLDNSLEIDKSSKISAGSETTKEDPIVSAHVVTNWYHMCESVWVTPNSHSTVSYHIQTGGYWKSSKLQKDKGT